MQRRVQGRVPLPRIAVDPVWARAQQAMGRPLVRFGDIPLEWSDFRLTLRQTADILLRFDALERPDLKDEPWTPVTQRRLQGAGVEQADIFEALKGGDILVHHPYDSFATSAEAFIDQAASDGLRGAIDTGRLQPCADMSSSAICRRSVRPVPKT